MEPADKQKESGSEQDKTQNDEIGFLLEYGGSTLPEFDLSGRKRRRKSKQGNAVQDSGQIQSTSTSSSKSNPKNETKATPGPGSSSMNESNQLGSNSNEADSDNSRKLNNEDSVRISKSRTNLLRNSNNVSATSESQYRTRPPSELTTSAEEDSAATQDRNFEQLNSWEGFDWSSRGILATAVVLTGLLVGYGLMRAFGQAENVLESGRTIGNTSSSASGSGRIPNMSRIEQPHLAKCHLPQTK